MKWMLRAAPLTGRDPQLSTGLWHRMSRLRSPGPCDGSGRRRSLRACLLQQLLEVDAMPGPLTTLQSRPFSPLWAALICFGLCSCGRPSMSVDAGVETRDLCEPDHGGCEQLCSTVEEKVVCGCEPGGILQGDGQHCQGWSLPQCTDTHDFVARDLRVAYTASGGAMVLHAAPTRLTPWTNPALLPSRFLVRATSFDSGTGWGEQQDLSELNIERNFECLALSRVNTRGEVLALMGLGRQPVVARKLLGADWSAPSTIATAEGTPFASPECVATLDDSGNGFAVQPSDDIYGARLAGDSWSAAEILEPTSAVSNVKLVARANGNTLMVWHQRSRLAWKRFVPETGWTTATYLSAEAELAGPPALAMNERGDAVMVWPTAREAAAVTLQLMAATFTERDGWTEPRFIADLGYFRANFGVAAAINSKSEALITWSQRLKTDDTRTFSAARFSPDQGWSEPLTLSDSISARADSPTVALDEQGNVVVAWTQTEAQVTTAWASRYLQGVGWIGPGRIGRILDEHSTMSEAHIGIDARGRVTAIWATSDLNGVDTSRLCVSHWE